MKGKIMGFFSWVTSDTNRSISNNYSSRGTFTVYLLCPDGTAILENDYDGYGVFGGYDVYELVADWNKDSVTADNLRKPVRDNCWGEEGYNLAVSRYERDCQMLQDFKDGKTYDYMVEKYKNTDWKRSIGILIACYDDQNEALEYPIKFVENPKLKYSWVMPSVSCDCQGYFYDDEDDEEDEWWN